jgi:hypothetical protein
MARWFEIPLSPVPQQFAITLSDVAYTLRFRFRNHGSFGGDGGMWVMDISDRNGVPMLAGLPLFPGKNLLDQYDYLGFGGQLWLETAGDRSKAPSFYMLGIESRLYWVTI